MDKDRLQIHVNIADKSYGLWINTDEEELARKAAKQLQQKFIQYRQHFGPDVDVRDLIAMIAFQLAMNNLELESNTDTKPFADRILQLTDKLDVYLNKK